MGKLKKGDPVKIINERNALVGGFTLVMARQKAPLWTVRDEGGQEITINHKRVRPADTDEKAFRAESEAAAKRFAKKREKERVQREAKMSDQDWRGAILLRRLRAAGELFVKEAGDNRGTKVDAYILILKGEKLWLSFNTQNDALGAGDRKRIIQAIEGNVSDGRPVDDLDEMRTSLMARGYSPA